MKRFIFLWILAGILFLHGCIGVSQTSEQPSTLTPVPSPTQTPLPTLTVISTQTALPTNARLPKPTTLPTQTSAPLPTAAPQTLPTTEGGGAVQDPTVEKLIALAVQDLLTRANVSADAITVKSVEPMEWRDSSLGCPQEGMMYMQVITPGYLIVLEMNGITYEYHTSYNNIVYCEK